VTGAVVGKWHMVELLHGDSGVLLETFAAAEYVGTTRGVDGGEWPSFVLPGEDWREKMWRPAEVQVDGESFEGLYDVQVVHRQRWGPYLGEPGRVSPDAWSYCLVCYPLPEPYPLLDEVLS
jgi:hypothetical protein